MLTPKDDETGAPTCPLLRRKDTVTVLWTTGASGDPHQETGTCSLDEFLKANDSLDGDYLEEMRTFLSCAPVGEPWEDGGGAAPGWSVRVVPCGCDACTFERHRADDPHCTCNDCTDHHFGEDPQS